jgi:two-component system CitB family sensor kinase
MKRPRLSLATQILAFQLGIILAAVALGAAASVWWAQGQLDKRYEAKALSIAQSVASMSSVRDALHDANPSKTLQPLAEGLRHASGASFVVITDGKGIRMSHPNKAMIGKPIDEAAKGPLSGQTFVGIENGTLGRSVRGKAPIIDGNGRIIGIVSVGFLVETVASQAADLGPQVGIFLVIALALGSVGSVLLTRRLKRQTFGLEPRELVGLLEQREASLHGIREGTIATDRQGRITLLNDEARRLLRLPENAEGRRLENLLPAGRVHDILTGEASGSDQVVIARDRVLLVNRMPVVVRDETIGWVSPCATAPSWNPWSASWATPGA